MSNTTTLPPLLITKMETLSLIRSSLCL